MYQKPLSKGLQLFPPPPKKASKPARKPSTKRHASSSQDPESAISRARSPSFATPIDGGQSALDGQQSSLGRQTPQTTTASPITVPGPSYQSPDTARSHTSFSEAPTLVRSNSNSSHNSIAKRGLHESQREEPIMHSIFPRYNPELPLEHQAYFPTQTSPTHIPREIINRRPYSPSLNERSPIQSPMAFGTSPGRFPRGISDDPPMVPSSVEEMKQLWKVVNGWRVSPSEGRTFCLKLSSAAEEPVHTLSCATQPFYTMRIIPTSTSGQMTLLRHDPSKSAADTPSKPSIISNFSKPRDTGTTEVLSTTLEETARRLPPNDGLVALLYPRAASNMVIDLASRSSPRSDFQQVMEAAERECGRLVWDEDTKKYYLVHPALVTPFVVVITSSPAWSRVEYVLEHAEMPRNLVRLVRDGAGGGFLEVDTGAAGRVDAFYVVDVAICAVLLVALAEEKSHNIERFDAPPSLAPTSPKSPKSLKSPILGMGAFSKLGKKEKRDVEKEIKMEEFELDLESQDSLKSKKKQKRKSKESTDDEDEKVPGCCGLLWMLMKCFVWLVAGFFKLLGKIVGWLCGRLTKKES
ncbi:hypothetical protein B0O99DRAFT_650835 [Bisporella sp. PMI_857]|nr:hypothetical protein B0O99DRAFT_650835 [Bisporella sp. PMI_857]